MKNVVIVTQIATLAIIQAAIGLFLPRLVFHISSAWQMDMVFSLAISIVLGIVITLVFNRHYLWFGIGAGVILFVVGTFVFTAKPSGTYIP